MLEQIAVDAGDAQNNSTDFMLVNRLKKNKNDRKTEERNWERGRFQTKGSSREREKIIELEKGQKWRKEEKKQAD